MHFLITSLKMRNLIFYGCLSSYCRLLHCSDVWFCGCIPTSSEEYDASIFRVDVTLRQMVCQSDHLGVEPLLGNMIEF
jgi:hypothetical protein